MSNPCEVVSALKKLIGVCAVVGEVRALATSYVPEGFVPCDGAIYSVDDYPLAGARLGSTYGGDGVTTFGVPDYRERTLRGADTAEHIGALGGSDTVTLKAANVPAHSHEAKTSIAVSTRTNNGYVMTEGAVLASSTIGPRSAGIYRGAGDLDLETETGETMALGGVTTTVSCPAQEVQAIDVTNSFAFVNHVIALEGI